MSKFYEKVLGILKKDKRFFSAEGELLRNVVFEAAMKMDPGLIKLLYKEKETRERFFADIEGVAVFDKIGFSWVVNNREFLPDSYTRYKNKIGLMNAKGDYLASLDDVELAFPYKDCLLEMDSTAEKEDRKEVFYNEVLLASELDRLLYPKVFTKAKKYSPGKSERAAKCSGNQNLLIKGNNLFVLYSLLPRYEHRIKLMYWDILYNSDSDKVPYNDSFKHSSWLVMMKNRLEVAKRLLSSDGMIFIQCDDREMAYLKVLCDEIFVRDNYVNTITVKTKLAGVSGSSEGKSLIDATEFILVYARDKSRIDIKPAQGGVPLLDVIKEYKESGKSWKYTTVLIDKGTRVFLKEDKKTGYKYYGYTGTKTQSVKQFAKANAISEDEVYTHHYDKIYRTTNAQSSVRTTVENETGHLDYQFVGLEYVPIKGKNAGKEIEILYSGASRAMVTFLQERIIEGAEGEPLYRDRVSTIWTDIDYNNLKKEGGVELPFGKKPEKLVARIIDLVAESGDIVLDAYLGTGTTAAVAMKKGITFIGIEQLDSHMDKAVRRLKNVINGDATGISLDTEWNGGGSFIYFELAKLNQIFVEKIQEAKDDNELFSIWDEIQKKGFISHMINPVDINPNAKELKELSFTEKKMLFMEVLDFNQLYINYCDIDDESYGVSEEDIEFTHSFYREVE